MSDDVRLAIARGRDELERTRAEIATLRDASRLERARALEARYRKARRKLAEVLVAGFFGGCVYWAVLHWKSRPDFVVVRLGPTDPKELQELLAELRPALSRAREEGDEAALGALPPLEPPRSTSYPALARYELGDESAPDGTLRWVNAGVAACTVGEVEQARWALAVLRSTGPEDPRAPRPRILSRSIAALVMSCSGRGHALFSAPPASSR